MNQWLRRPALLALLPIVVYAGLVAWARPAGDHPFFDLVSDRPLVIAHQGGEQLRPSNTMAAFTHAVELGVDVLELDVHSSADGVLVVIHDDTVDRTTDGSGRVNELTLEQIKALDAGHYWTDDEGETYPFRDQGITIATLEELFQAFPDMPMNIEIKQVEPKIGRTLCDMLDMYGMRDQVLVASFRKEAMDEFREVCPGVATSLVENEVRALFYRHLGFVAATYRPPQSAHAVQVPQEGGGFRILQPRFVRAAHARNLEVHAWTINDPAEMQEMLDLGVDGIITDRPDLLLQLLAQ